MLGPGVLCNDPAGGNASLARVAPIGKDEGPVLDEADLGLAGKKPNIEIPQSFVIARPQAEVWSFLDDIARVVPCMPGATLSAVRGDRLRGQLAIKLGPIAATFDGEARVVRDALPGHATRCPAAAPTPSAATAAPTPSGVTIEPLRAGVPAAARAVLPH